MRLFDYVICWVKMKTRFITNIFFYHNSTSIEIDCMAKDAFVCDYVESFEMPMDCGLSSSNIILNFSLEKEQKTNSTAAPKECSNFSRERNKAKQKNCQIFNFWQTSSIKNYCAQFKLKVNPCTDQIQRSDRCSFKFLFRNLVFCLVAAEQLICHPKTNKHVVTHTPSLYNY